jgi:hypothetical protein
VELSFLCGYLPFHAQKQAVVKIPRIIEAVFVADEGGGHAAQFLWGSITRSQRLGRRDLGVLPTGIIVA